MPSSGVRERVRRVVVWATCAVLVGSPGCSLEVDYAGSSFTCPGGGPCPSGFECVQDVCVRAGGTDDPDGGDGPPTDAGREARSWRDDAPGDFIGAFDQVAVAPRGALEPVAYLTGALVVHASDTGVIGDAASTTWQDVSGFPATARTGIARGSVVDWGSAIPPGLGLSDGNLFTVWFEGEVYLDAGVTTFELLADDDGFLELAPAGAAFVRVASAAWPVASQGTFTAASAGWYPVRWAESDNTGGASVSVRYKPPGAGAFTAIPRHRLRARADGLRGLVQVAFGDQRMLGDTAATIDDAAPAFVDWQNGRPADLALPSSDDFSVRWSGQLRVDVAGDYVFRYASDGGQRLWLDGQRLLDAWDTSVHDQVTAPVTLAPGWHDLVVDVMDANGTARALLTVDSGPELVGQPWPVERLRPVEGRAERFEAVVGRADLAIPDNGLVDEGLPVVAPPGATVTGVDLSYTFDHTYPDDLVFAIFSPSGQGLIVRSRAGGSTGVVGEKNRFFLGGLDGKPAGGTWVMRVEDQESQDVGTLRDVQLTVHHGSGEPPFPLVAAYESPVRDLGAVTSIDRVSWTPVARPGASVRVRVRSGASAAACASAPWSEPLPEPASAPAVDALPFVQYRVELLSDTGDVGAAVEAVQIDYQVLAP